MRDSSHIARYDLPQFEKYRPVQSWSNWLHKTECGFAILMGLLFGKTTYKVFVSQMDNTIIFYRRLSPQFYCSANSQTAINQRGEDLSGWKYWLRVSAIAFSHYTGLRAISLMSSSWCRRHCVVDSFFHALALTSQLQDAWPCEEGWFRKTCGELWRAGKI